jgi:hypothetical protein
VRHFIESSHYLKSASDAASLNSLLQLHEAHVMQDGVRRRCYLKLTWDRSRDVIAIAKNQAYFQTAKSNIVDGGKIRQFAIMNKNVIELAIMKNIIQFNLSVIKKFTPLIDCHELTFGLHFIQYKANQYDASYSSPDYLHIDDEPLVFVHLLHLTENAWGGDNLIADIETKTISNVIRLEKPLETVLLTRDYYHAVTPLGSREGEARRDILLFTVEPSNTQVQI